MGKVSVQVMVPAVGKTHHFLIPDSMSIGKVIQLMAMTLSDEYGIIKSLHGLTLLDSADNKALNNSCSLKQMGINNGAKLMLM